MNSPVVARINQLIDIWTVLFRTFGVSGVNLFSAGFSTLLLLLLSFYTVYTILYMVFVEFYTFAPIVLYQHFISFATKDFHTFSTVYKDILLPPFYTVFAANPSQYG